MIIVMIIDLSSIIKSYGAKLSLDQALQLPKLELSGQEFDFITPVSVAGEVVNSGSVLELKATASGTIKTICARCTKEFNMPFSVDIFETLAQQSDQNEFEADDIILFAGYTITLDEIVANGILTNLSIQFICSKTC